MEQLIFHNAQIIDGVSNQPIEYGYLRTEGDRIVEVGEGEPASGTGLKVDAQGGTILPGLIDAHVHLVWDGSPDPMRKVLGQPDTKLSLWAYANALKTLELGITTVRDLGSPGRTVIDLAKVAHSGALPGPNVLASGPALVMTGGHIHEISLEVDGIDALRAAARRVIKEGADLVKLMASGGIYTEGEEPGSPQLSIEEMRAAIEEAHKRQKKVAAHAEGLEGIQNALTAGVDTIEHGIFADEEALHRMADQGVALVPTMAVMRRLATDPRIPPFAQEKARVVTEPHFQMLRRAIKLGVPIATGTDAGSPCSPPDVYFEELTIMEEAGMSPMQVIQASTSVAARVIGRPDIGSLEPGQRADFILVRGNPLEELDALKSLRSVVIGGRFFRNAE